MKRAIRTDGAPAAIGPYSQAIRAGNMVWLSGQIALDPETMKMVGETAAEQAVQVLNNMTAVLSEAGASFSDVVLCTIFLADMDVFAEVNAVYADFMPQPAPARATVEVSRLPKDARIEISAVVVIED